MLKILWITCVTPWHFCLVLVRVLLTGVWLRGVCVCWGIQAIQSHGACALASGSPNNAYKCLPSLVVAIAMRSRGYGAQSELTLISGFCLALYKWFQNVSTLTSWENWKAESSVRVCEWKFEWLGECQVDGIGWGETYWVNFVPWNIWWWWRWCGAQRTAATRRLRDHWQQPQTELFLYRRERSVGGNLSVLVRPPRRSESDRFIFAINHCSTPGRCQVAWVQSEMLLEALWVIYSSFEKPTHVANRKWCWRYELVPLSSCIHWL